MSDKDVPTTDSHEPEGSVKKNPLKEKLRALGKKISAPITRQSTKLIHKVTDPIIAVFRQRPILSTGVTVGSVLTILGVVTGAMRLYEHVHRRLPAPPIHSVLAKWDEGDREGARELAAKLFARTTGNPREMGTAMHILGATILEDARETKQRDEQKKTYLLASRYLEEAREHGFSPGRVADGLEKLAECFYAVKHYARAIPVLRDALKEETPHRTELLRMLADSHFSDADPNFPLALEANSQYLTRADLTEHQREDALLRQARIQFKMEKFDDCRATLVQVPETARTEGDLIVIRGRLLMMDAERLRNDPELRKAGTHQNQYEAKLREAIDVFKFARVKSVGGQEPSRQAAYLLGVCLRSLDDVEEAAKQFGRAHAESVDTPEGVVAAMGEAEMLLRLRQLDAAIKAYQRALLDVGPIEEFSNPFVTLEELRKRLEAGYSEFFAAKEYPLAIEMATAIPPTVPEGRAVQLRAEAHRTLAEALELQAQSLVGEPAEALLKQAREQFRLAGNDFARLSEFRLATNEHMDDLWTTANCYLRGQDYRRSATFIQRYLNNEPRRRRPQALVVLAETQMAAYKLEEAMKPLNECVEFYSRDPISFRARLLLSRIHIDRLALREAKQLLQENIESEVLSPQSIEYRDSLFELGHVLYYEARDAARSVTSPADPTAPTLAEMQAIETLHEAFEEALRRLSEAVRRYPRTPQTTATRYMVAEINRALTRLPRAKREAAVLETTRNAYQVEIAKRLEAASQEYTSLRAELLDKHERSEIKPLETTLLRNVCFGRADVLFELERYPEAIEEYGQAVSRFQNEPESLEAMVRVATCQRYLNQPEEARGTLRQALFLLSQIPQEKDFKKTTRYAREDWTQYLNWLATN